MSENPIESGREEPSILDGSVATIFGEGLALLLVSAACYLGAYFFQRAYLEYYYLDPVFISIGISELLTYGGIVILQSLVLWQLISLMPLPSVRFMSEYLLPFSLEITIVIGAAIRIYWAGYDWVSVSIALLAILLIGWHVIGLALSAIRGRPLDDYFRNHKDIDTRSRQHIILSKTANSVISSRIGSAFFVAGISILFGAAISMALGAIYAKYKQRFTAVQVEDEQYVVISSFSEGVVLSGIDGPSDDGTVILTRETRWVSLDQYSLLTASILDARLQRPADPWDNPRSTFGMFCQANGFSWCATR